MKANYFAPVSALIRTTIIRMKKFWAILPILFIAFTTQAQVRQVLDAVKPKKAFEGTPILQKKSQLISLGIGAPNKLSDFLDFEGIGNIIGTTTSDRSFGPFLLDYEYLINDNLGLGASFLFATAKKEYNFFGTNYSGDIRQFQFGASTYYHIYTTDKLDPYFKGTVGINLWDGKYKDNNSNETGNFVAPTPFGFRTSVGLRYFFSENLALQGGGSATISPNFNIAANFGIAYKIK